MVYDIVAAEISDFEEILSLYRACGADMMAKGFDNWGDFYPPVARITEDLEKGTLFVLREKDSVIKGVIVLDECQDETYAGVSWSYHETPIMVVHRLAVLPGAQGKGYAQQLMRFAEKHGRQAGMKSIRLDAYCINNRLLGFYAKLGYEQKKELINLGERFTHLFNCFEKKI